MMIWLELTSRDYGKTSVLFNLVAQYHAGSKDGTIIHLSGGPTLHVKESYDDIHTRLKRAYER